MAEEEVQVEAQEKKPEAPPSTGPLGGVKGIILVVAVVVLEAVFFLFLMDLQAGKTVQQGDSDAGERVRQDLETYNQFVVPLQNLHYSVKTPGGGSNATLSMSLLIVLGKTPEEIQRGDAEITNEDFAKFEAAVERMIPDIQSELVRHITQQTYNQLASASGKQKIQEFVKERVNDQLENLNIKDLSDPDMDRQRVTKVLFTNFILQ